jgi:hypothetical protein
MRAAVLAALAGCGFSPTPLAGSLTVDAARVTGSDAGMVATSDAPNPRPCYAPDLTGIVMCLELDDPDLVGSGIARDGAPGHHDATVTNGDPAMRSVPAPSPAQTISTSSGAAQATIEVPDSADFALQHFTLMAWIDLTAYPTASNAYGIVEKLGAFNMYIDTDGGVDCTVGSGGQGVLGDIVPQNTWALVACTFDGSQVCSVATVGGSGQAAEPQCSDVTLAGVASTNPVLVGARFDGTMVFNHMFGSLDSARIFNRALSAAQICVGGGRTGC